MSVLHSFILKRGFLRAVKSGFYMDFFYKKLCEVFVRNALICASYIVGEKYMVEFVTKLSVDKVITSFLNFQDSTQAEKSKLFFQVLTMLLYFMAVLFTFYILYL